MAFYRHDDQRPFHLLRYGPRHALSHMRQERHGHRRVVVPPEDRLRNGVIYALVAAGLILLLVIVMGIVSFLSIHRAEDDLNAAKSIIAADLGNKSLLTSADGRTQLANDIGEVQKDAAEATDSLTGSVSLSILGHLPVVDTQRQGVITLSTDVEKASNVAAALLAALNNLVSNSHGTTVSLPALAAMQVYVEAGHKNLAALNRPATGLLGPLASARKSFDKEDLKLERLLSLSQKTIAFAAPFLGANGPQTYLIAGLNNAEMRDSGAVLSLDLLTTTNGSFQIAHESSYATYALNYPAPVTLPAGTQQVFGSYLPTLNWPSTNATADWALSSQMMQAMWQQATGQTVDGVIGMDVPGVARLLDVTGPVDIAGLPVPISSKNIGNQLLNKAYAGLGPNSPQGERHDMIAAVVKAAVDKMKTEHVDLDSFANALSYDVEERHLMVWSDVPQDETGLVALDAAGTLDSTLADRTIHVAVENTTADKLDYFVAVSMAVKVDVDAEGDAVVNTKVTVANFAQKGQPPSYQYGPDGVNAFTPGQYGPKIFFWGPLGSDMPGSVPESGLQLDLTHFSLLPGQKGTASFSTVIPHAVVNGQLQLRLIPQARLMPDRLTVQISAPGWDLSGPRTIRGHLSSTEVLSWGLVR